MIPTIEGEYTVEWKDGREYEGIYPLEVYMHPESGLCVWFEDYAGRGGIDSPISTDGSGHVPILCSGLKFVKRIGDLQ